VTNERTLLELAKQYDEAALGELYDRYAPRIYAYIYRRVDRVGEIQALVAEGRRVPDESVARIERHIECALTQAAWASDEETTGLLTRIAERTRTQAQMLEQMQATAPRQAQAVLERAVTVCRRGAKAAEDGLDDPWTFRWRYRHQQGACPEPAEGTPEPTSESEQVTATPRGDQEQGQDRDWQRDQQCEQERDCTPVGTPHNTPHGPQATPVPQATPHGQQATPGPQATPHGQQATPRPPATTPQPQQPSDGQGGDGQDGGEQGGGGQSGGSN